MEQQIISHEINTLGWLIQDAQERAEQLCVTPNEYDEWVRPLALALQLAGQIAGRASASFKEQEKEE
jgi:hypothetical protein